MSRFLIILNALYACGMSIFATIAVMGGGLWWSIAFGTIACLWLIAIDMRVRLYGAERSLEVYRRFSRDGGGE